MAAFGALGRFNSAIAGTIDPATIPNQFTIEDWHRYENSTKSKNSITWDLSRMRVVTGRQKKWRKETRDEWLQIWRILKSSLPSIAYFPTFLSQVPDRVYLRGHEDDKTNTFYRTIFQDILYQIGPNYTIKSQILDRLDEKEEGGLISQAIAAFWGSPRRGMVQQLIDKAGAKGEPLKRLLKAVDESLK